MFVLFLVITLSNFVFNGNQNISEIVPLKSNRKDVEKLLGFNTKKDCSTCTYFTSEAKVEVIYSTSKCGSSMGWDIPIDTVIQVTVTLNEKKYFEQLHKNKQKFLSFITDDGTTYYLDEKHGIKYMVESSGFLAKLFYLPKNNYNSLRCKGFPKYNVVGSSYFPIYDFDISDINEVKGQIDSFYSTFGIEGDKVNIYFIFYQAQDDKPNSNKYKEFLSKIKDFSYNQLKISPKLLKIIEGGKRNSSTAEVFVIPSNYPPPVPSPNFSSLIFK